jgi:iron complex outermembrane receptor protein
MECLLQQEELVEEETLTTINNIESISVLKDASATAIYGSRKPNGVILLTKSCKAGEMQVSYGNLQVSEITEQVDALSTEQFKDFINANGTTAQKALVGNASTNGKIKFRTAVGTDHNITLRC